MTNTIFSINAAEHYVKVPDDFPRYEIAGAVAVFQSKPTLVEHEGKYYMHSGTPPELDARLEICEDTGQQRVVKSIERWQYWSLPPHRRAPRMGGSGHGHHAGRTHT